MARKFIGNRIWAEYEDGELLLTKEVITKKKKGGGGVSDLIALDTSGIMLLIQFLSEEASPGVINMLNRMLRPIDEP